MEEDSGDVQQELVYTARPQTALKLSGPTSRVLTSSVMEIKGEKDGIKVLLQQI